jgi:acyl-coenzyme A thioesterase PaaI-like protein
LSGNYLAPAPLGSWVYGCAEITRATKSIIFMKCNLYINDTLIFNADGIFKILKNHGTKDPS